MYYGGWRHCNVVKLNDDFTGLVPFEDGEYYKEVTPERYVEGPFMFMKDGKYNMIFLLMPDGGDMSIISKTGVEGLFSF